MVVMPARDCKAGTTRQVMEMADEIVLWGAGSTRSMRAHWMLRELGLAYDCHPIGSRTGETETDDYGRLNPRRKIPVLRHGEVVLSESAAIVGYLAERFGDRDRLYLPADPAGRARVAEWCYFVMTELDAHTLYVIRRHQGLAHIYGEAPQAVAAAEAYFLKQLGAMTGAARAAAPYLFGPRLSTADILLMTCLDWARFYDIDLPEDWRAYQSRVGERPAYLDAFAVNYPERSLADAR